MSIPNARSEHVTRAASWPPRISVRVRVREMTWRARLRRVITATCLSTVVACSSSPAASPTEPDVAPYLAGRVTAIVRAGSSASVRVEANPNSTTLGLKAVAQVDGQTLVLLPGRVVGDQRSLALGQWVRVWFDGAIAQSYPVQGTAGTVVIDSTGVVPAGS